MKSAQFDLSKKLLLKFAPYALLVLAVLVAYENVYGNEFLLDDEFLIIKNSFLRFYYALPKLFTSCSTAGAGGVDSFYRPMQGLLYFIVFQTVGFSLFGFHLLNVSLHAANACLVYLLGRRVGFDKTAMFVAALLWAVHPIHTEAVTYMSATADPLYAFFVLAGICVLLPDFSVPRVFWACILFALGLLSKETAIVFPLLATLCLFLVSPERKKLKPYLKTFPLWSLATVYLVVRFFILHLNDVQFYKHANPYSNNITARIFTFLATLPSYGQVFLWPEHLHPQRNFPVFVSFDFWPVIAGAFLFLAGAVLFLRPILSRDNKGLVLGWGVGWFGAAHLLHTGLLMAVNSIFLEHWLYLPTAGLMLSIAQSLAVAFKTHERAFYRVMLMAGALGALGLGFLTFRQNLVWHDPIVFYETILAYGDESASVHNNLAMAYADRGDIRKAIEQYRAAIATTDTFPQPHHNLARAYLELNDGKNHAQEAIAELERAIAIDPGFFQSYSLLAEIYDRLGEHEKAENYRKKTKAILQSR